MANASDAGLKVLAVASGGGHWVQLMRLMPAFAGCRITYASTFDYAADLDGADFRLMPDGNRWDKRGLVRMILAMAWLVLRRRPHIVISTGAAPGLVALALGRATGARTIWVDSIANAEELSMSGRMAGRIAHLWLTQWPHLAAPGGPDFAGSVL